MCLFCKNTYAFILIIIATRDITWITSTTAQSETWMGDLVGFIETLFAIFYKNILIINIIHL